MAPTERPQPGLGQAIRQLRTDQGMSQEDLAHQADVHPTWVSHLESGRNNPSWATVQRLSQALGVKLSEVAALAEKIER
jgi:transcriptional regulator with XRE-family HTH domain